MKKVIIVFSALVIIAIAGFAGYVVYRNATRTFPNSDKEVYDVSGIGNLDHDIYVANVTKICDEKKTGFDVIVGPTGWPWGDPVEWEVALYEDSDCYYARLIFHEYMLWWSFDDPYIVCKIPKKNVSGDLAKDEKLRYDVLWRITYVTLRSYDYSPYMPNAIVQKINGHTVSFGDYGCRYEKYFVICDESNKW